ncbi:MULTISPECIES: phosphodiesterase [Vibrio]|uniref:phosphodiesterase n=1 Tax=Vibrio TaxID=662 RepID=UPI000C165A74|nr:MULTISPECIES: phosphodiesterase [Vibrio]NNN44149.1 phosphodiesterase [Vibrio sp. 1-1(7)]NNN71973.1 phosphodiesterase [Vibrio sp. 12-2(3-a)]
MKLFIASDLHGSLPATEKTIQAFTQSGANTLILLGDLLNHGPRNPVPTGYNPPAVAECLNQYAQQIIAVRGNCDSEVDQMLFDFPMMSDFAWVLLESGRRLFLTHGHLYQKDNRPQLQHGDVFVQGHTHIALAELQTGVYQFNPGSVTFPRQEGIASYGLLEGEHLTVYSFQQDVLAQIHLI